MKNIKQMMVWLQKKAFSQCVIVTDNTVKKHYGISLQNSLEKAGCKALLISFPAGDKHKNNDIKEKIETRMFAANVDRQAVILALGGGVIGDIAGFVAATYLRGIPYIQIPTTLLAMVDSSIGGKTGINTVHGKNTIGCIYHPVAIVREMVFLKTLSKKHMLNGLIEIIKLFLTHDAQSFKYVEKNPDRILEHDEMCLSFVMKRAISIKKNIVSRDETDKNERLLLNFGHTIGHALEKYSDYAIPHGVAVGYGMLAESAISVRLGLLELEKYHVIKNVLGRLGLRTEHFKKWDVDRLILSTKNDKKNKNKKTHYVLLSDLGKAYVKEDSHTHAVDDKVVKSVLRGLM